MVDRGENAKSVPTPFVLFSVVVSEREYYVTRMDAKASTLFLDFSSGLPFITKHVRAW